MTFPFHPTLAGVTTTFVPTSISGLMAWYPFNNAGNTVVSGAYSNVLDLSGNGYNLSQSAAANRPTQQVGDSKWPEHCKVHKR